MLQRLNGTASTDPEKQDENMESYMKRLLNIFLHQLIIVKNRCNFKWHCLIIMIMLAELELDVYFGEQYVGQQVALMKLDGTVKQFRVTKFLVSLV